MSTLLILCRLVHFASAMAVFGIAAFRLYAFAGVVGAPEAGALAAFDRSTGRSLAGAGGAMLISGLLMVPCVAASMAGSPRAAFDPSIERAVLLGTDFGRVWCWHLLLTIVLVALSARPARRVSHGALTAVSGLALASLGWVGHAAMDAGMVGLGHELNQALHLLAGGGWLGGLQPLGWLLRRARPRDGAPFATMALEALPHFSQMGYGAVALLALTGIINTALLVGSPAALVGTAYGRLLGIKLTLFVAMIAAALLNRLLLMPRLRRTPMARLADARAALAALARSVAIEQGLGIAILAAVSVLGTWAPAVASLPR